MHPESDLTFDFSDVWIVVRYDAHRYYRMLSGHGYRGVDFLLLHRREPRSLWIEVKNYRRRHLNQVPEHLAGYVRQPERLAAVLAKKADDTARAIAEVTHWYLRRWWWPVTGAPVVGLAARPNSRLRPLDRAFFPLLHRWQPPTYLVVLELEDAYPELPDLDAAGFGESLQSYLHQRGLRAHVGPQAQLRTFWS